MLKAGIVGSLTFSGLSSANDWSIPFLGVPLTVVGVAAFGTLLSFAVGDPIKPRKKMYTQALAFTFVASVAVAVFPRMLGWDWVDPKLEPPLAGLLAFGAKWLVPAIVSAIPEVIRKVFRLDKSGATSEDK